MNAGNFLFASLMALSLIGAQVVAVPTAPNPEVEAVHDDPEPGDVLEDMRKAESEALAPHHPGSLVLLPVWQHDSGTPTAVSVASYLQLMTSFFRDSEGREYTLDRFSPATVVTGTPGGPSLSGPCTFASSILQSVKVVDLRVAAEVLELRTDLSRPSPEPPFATVEKQFIVERYSVLVIPAGTPDPWTAVLGSGFLLGRTYVSFKSAPAGQDHTAMVAWKNAAGSVFTAESETFSANQQAAPRFDLSDFLHDFRDIAESAGEVLPPVRSQFAHVPGMSDEEADLLAPVLLHAATPAAELALLRGILSSGSPHHHIAARAGILAFLLGESGSGLPTLSQELAAALGMDPRARAEEIERIIANHPLPPVLALSIRRLQEDLSSSSTAVLIPVAGVFDR